MQFQMFGQTLISSVSKAICTPKNQCRFHAQQIFDNLLLFLLSIIEISCREIPSPPVTAERREPGKSS